MIFFLTLTLTTLLTTCLTLTNCDFAAVESYFVGICSNELLESNNQADWLTVCFPSFFWKITLNQDLNTLRKKKSGLVFNTGDHSIVLVKSKWSCLAWSLTMFRLVWKISVIIIPMWRLLSCLWPSSPHKVYGWSIITGKLQKENNVSTL